MNTISILKRTLQALAITGISIFALSPVIAGVAVYSVTPANIFNVIG
jgi:hypothetical protein